MSQPENITGNTPLNPNPQGLPHAAGETVHLEQEKQTAGSSTERAQGPPSGQERTDPADLIFFSKLTPDRFFAETQRLGVSQAELCDQQTYNRVFRSCLIRLRTETVKAVAATLDLTVSEAQAEAIALNSLVPDVFPEPAPLTSDERKLAEKLYFHALRAAVAREGRPLSDRMVRAAARRMVRHGEKGLTLTRRLARTVGCLVLLGTAGLASSLALLAALWLSRLAGVL